MSLAVAIQMDPIGPVNIHEDSTFLLALEAQRRGHQLYHYLPSALSFDRGTISASGHPLQVFDVAGDHYRLGAAQELALAEMDVVLMRQDPPFDMAYITATHILEHLQPRPLVVNDPTAVRNAPEKLFVTHYPDLMPATLITADKARIEAFRQAYGDIILKPLYGNGGSGVFHLRPEDPNLGALLEMFTQLSREPVIAQQYLPEIRDGDKRIILVDGEPLGAVARVPAQGEARANFHAGGRPEAAELDARDREICRAIGAELKRRGLLFAGIDVIGGYLTEINVTSPTGLHEINRLSGTRLEAAIWAAIEGRLG